MCFTATHHGLFLAAYEGSALQPRLKVSSKSSMMTKTTSLDGDVLMTDVLLGDDEGATPNLEVIESGRAAQVVKRQEVTLLSAACVERLRRYDLEKKAARSGRWLTF